MASFPLFNYFEMNIWSKRLVESGYASGMIFYHISDAHQEAILAEPAFGRLSWSFEFTCEFVHFALERLTV